MVRFQSTDAGHSPFVAFKRIPYRSLDKNQVTIIGPVPAEAVKLVFTTDTGAYTTFFSADASGKLAQQQHHVPANSCVS